MERPVRIADCMKSAVRTEDGGWQFSKANRTVAPEYEIMKMLASIQSIMFVTDVVVHKRFFPLQIMGGIGAGCYAAAAAAIKKKKWDEGFIWGVVGGMASLASSLPRSYGKKGNPVLYGWSSMTVVFLFGICFRRHMTRKGLVDAPWML